MVARIYLLIFVIVLTTFPIGVAFRNTLGTSDAGKPFVPFASMSVKRTFAESIGIAVKNGSDSTTSPPVFPKKDMGFLILKKGTQTK